MSTTASLLAIGGFSSSIAGCLDYPPEYYEGVAPGTIVVSHIFVCETKKESEAVATFLDIDLYNFDTHFFNNFQAKKLVDRSRSELPEYTDGGYVVDRDYYVFVKLVLFGFDFILLPGH